VHLFIYSLTDSISIFIENSRKSQDKKLQKYEALKKTVKSSKKTSFASPFKISKKRIE
jgi:hypothetical protein